MQMLEAKISSHNAETTDVVTELKAEVDTLHDKLEVIDYSICPAVCLSVCLSLSVCISRTMSNSG